MSINFGIGIPLSESRPELRDPQSRREIILDVVERDSVIEGLPPFSAETRQRILERLTVSDVPSPTPGE